MAIRNFKPDIYYALVSKEATDGEVIELQSKQKFDKTDFLKAKSLADAYNSAGAVVTSVKKKKDRLSPGKAVLFIKAPERPRQEIQDVDGGEP